MTTSSMALFWASMPAAMVEQLQFSSSGAFLAGNVEMVVHRVRCWCGPFQGRNELQC